MLRWEYRQAPEKSKGVMRAYEDIKQTNKIVVCVCTMLPDFHHHLLLLLLFLLPFLLVFLLPFLLLNVSL